MWSIILGSLGLICGFVAGHWWTVMKVPATPFMPRQCSVTIVERSGRVLHEVSVTNDTCRIVLPDGTLDGTDEECREAIRKAIAIEDGRA